MAIPDDLAEIIDPLVRPMDGSEFHAIEIAIGDLFDTTLTAPDTGAIIGRSRAVIHRYRSGGDAIPSGVAALMRSLYHVVRLRRALGSPPLRYRKSLARIKGMK